VKYLLFAMERLRGYANYIVDNWNSADSGKRQQVRLLAALVIISGLILTIDAGLSRITGVTVLLIALALYLDRVIRTRP